MVSAIETVEAGVYSTTDAIDFVTHPTTAIGRLRDPDPALVRFVRSNIDRLAQPQARTEQLARSLWPCGRVCCCDRHASHR